MKPIRYVTVFVTILLATVLVGCNKNDQGTADKQASSETALETQNQKISYVLGMNTGHQLKSMELELDKDAFSAGIGDALDGAEPKLGEDEIAAAVQAFETEMMAKREAAEKAAEEAFDIEAQGNQQEGEAFLAENAGKEGVTTTDSGLQYKVLVEGKGDKPSETSTVQVHYQGRLIDGTEFDSSIKRGVPAEFGVTQVIAGWTEALQLMPEGSKWELYIPSDLAYGPGGTGPIGPNQTLIFEVELLQANVSQEEAEASE